MNVLLGNVDVSALSLREQTCLRYLALGQKNQEIAESMGCTMHTVRSYIRITMDKTGIRTRAGLASWYVQGGHAR